MSQKAWCTISNFVGTPEGLAGRGIVADGTALTIDETILRDNSCGIQIQGGSDTRTTIRRCAIEGDGGFNTTGLEVWYGNRVALADSLLCEYGFGLYVRGAQGSPLAAVRTVHFASDLTA